MLYDMYSADGYDMTGLALIASGKTEDEINDMLARHNEYFDCPSRAVVMEHNTQKWVPQIMVGGRMMIYA